LIRVRAANKELIKQLIIYFIILPTAKLLRLNNTRWNGEKMAKKGCLKNKFSVPIGLYNELLKAARSKHQSLEEYKDELGFFLLLGQFEA
jgi:hypothetical protein